MGLYHVAQMLSMNNCSHRAYFSWREGKPFLAKRRLSLSLRNNVLLRGMLNSSVHFGHTPSPTIVASRNEKEGRFLRCEQDCTNCPFPLLERDRVMMLEAAWAEVFALLVTLDT